MDQKNLVLTNYKVGEIDLLPSDSEKIKHILVYLEDVHALLNRQNETIQSLLTANELLTSRLDSHGDHLQAHDDHLSSHSQHLATHDGHIKLLTNK